MTRHRSVNKLFHFLLLFLLGSPAAFANSEDERVLQELRQQGRLDLAVRHCQQWLADEGLSDADRIFLTIELARTHGQQAVQAPQSGEAFWKKGREAIDRLILAHRNHARISLAYVQQALLTLTRGEMAWHESQVAAEPAESLSAARALLRQAAGEFKQAEEEIEQELGRLSRRRSSDEPFSRDELLSLRDQVGTHLGRLFRVQAMTYPAESPDRFNSLSQAVERLGEITNSQVAADQAKWRSRLEMAACQRLLQSFDRAESELEALGAANLSTEMRLQAQAEKVRLTLAKEGPHKALEVVAAGREIQGESSPQLDLAHLEVYLSLWKAAQKSKQEDEIERWQKTTAQMARVIEQSHGAYWRRRCDRLLAESAGAGAAEVGILTRLADDAYRRQKYEEAAQMYQKAASQALRTGDQSQALALHGKAAAVRHKQGEATEAAAALASFAIKLADQPKAPDFHLAAISWLLPASQQDSAVRSQVVDLLETHLDRWPQSPTVESAAVRLGILYEQQGKVTSAIAAYTRVPVSSKAAEYAVDAAARCWEREILAQIKQGQPVDQMIQSASTYFERVIEGPNDTWPDVWGAAARKAATAEARLRLYYGNNPRDTAELLSKAIAGSKDASASWKTNAELLLALAHAQRPTGQQPALAALDRAADASPEQLVAFVEKLSHRWRDKNHRSSATVALRAIDLLRPQMAALPPATQTIVLRTRAEALAAAGRSAEALTAYQKLAKDEPNHGAVQRSFAEFLTAGDASWRAMALDQWRKVARRSRPGSEGWLHSKSQVAETLIDAGEKEQASQLVQYLLATRADLSDKWKARFERLLAKCEQRDAP